MTSQAYRQARRNHPDERFLKTPEWRRLRAKQLAEHPQCKHCGSIGRAVPATQVDHIRMPYGNERLMRDPANLMSLCATHHSSSRARGRSRISTGPTQSCWRNMSPPWSLSTSRTPRKTSPAWIRRADFPLAMRPGCASRQRAGPMILAAPPDAPLPPAPTMPQGRAASFSGVSTDATSSP